MSTTPNQPTPVPPLYAAHKDLFARIAARVVSEFNEKDWTLSSALLGMCAVLPQALDGQGPGQVVQKVQVPNEDGHTPRCEVRLYKSHENDEVAFAIISYWTATGQRTNWAITRNDALAARQSHLLVELYLPALCDEGNRLRATLNRACESLGV